MKESEAWFLLAEEIEKDVDNKDREYYICHILRDLIQGTMHMHNWPIMKGIMRAIPSDLAWTMMDRFKLHLAVDAVTTYNNPSWYDDVNDRSFNRYRVMACAWLGFEALEENK
jgi:hypothetical protein